MSFELKQRYFFITRRFELTGNSLKITVTKPGSVSEDEFKLEEISRKITRNKSFPLFYFLFFAVAIATITIGVMSKMSATGDSFFGWDDLVGLGVFTVLSGYVAISRYTNNYSLFLIDGRGIVFFASSPSAAQVDDFFNLIREKQKHYLIQKYGTQNEYISSEQLLTQLKWLYDHDFITEKELSSLKHKTMIRVATPANLTFNHNLN